MLLLIAFWTSLRQEIKLDEVIIATASGAISGLIGGSGANENLVLTNAIKGTKQAVTRELRRANQKYAQKVIASAISRRNGLLTSAISSASTKFGVGAGVANATIEEYKTIDLFSWYIEPIIY